MKKIKYTNIINRSFGRLEREISQKRLKLFKTLYVNFRTLKFYDAIKFPIYIYGRVKLSQLNGNIKFTSKVQRGMVKIGRHVDNYEQDLEGIIYLSSNSTIVFDGLCSIAQGVVIRLSEEGELYLGNKVWIGQNVKIDCTHSINIYEGTSITHGCFLTDGNHHFHLFYEDMSIKRHSGTIILGKYNWIGNGVTILKGTVTSDYCMVAQGGLLNSNYILKYNTSESMLLAGAPAKLLKKGCRRIFSSVNEGIVIRYFKNHPEENIFLWKDEFIDDVEDKYFL